MTDKMDLPSGEDDNVRGGIMPHWMQKWMVNDDFRALWPSLVYPLDGMIQQLTHGNHAPTHLSFFSPGRGETAVAIFTTRDTKASDTLYATNSGQHATAEAEPLKPKYHIGNFSQQVFIRASAQIQQSLLVENHEKEQERDINDITSNTPRRFDPQKWHDYLGEDGSADRPFDSGPSVWANWNKRYIKQPDDLLQDPKPRLGGSRDGLKNEAEEDTVFSSHLVKLGGENHLGLAETVEPNSELTKMQKVLTPRPAAEELESKIQQGRIRPSMLVSMLSEIKHEVATAENDLQRQQKDLEVETFQKLVSVYRTSEITAMFTANEKPMTWMTQHELWHEDTGKEAVDSPRLSKTGNITLATSGAMATIIPTTSQANQQIAGLSVAYFAFIIVVAFWLGMGMGFCWGRGLNQMAEDPNLYRGTEIPELTATEGTGSVLLASESRGECTRYGFPCSFWS